MTGEFPLWYHWECTIFVLLVVILCLMNNPLIFAPFSLTLVLHPPRDAVFHQLLDVPASLLGECHRRIDDDVGGEFLTFRELVLVGGAGVLKVLVHHEVLGEVLRGRGYRTGIEPAPALAHLDAHRPGGRAVVDVSRLQLHGVERLD